LLKSPLIPLCQRGIILSSPLWPLARRASLRAGGLYEPEADPEGKGESEGILSKYFRSIGVILSKVIKESIVEKTYPSENLPLPTGRQAHPSLPKRGIPPFSKGRSGGI